MWERLESRPKRNSELKVNKKKKLDVTVIGWIIRLTAIWHSLAYRHPGRIGRNDNLSPWWKKVGEGTLPWAISFFLKWKENKYLSPYAYCFIFKSDLLNPNFVEKNSYFILFFLESYFFDEQSRFLDVRFYWNKKFKHRFIYEQKLK